MTYAYIRVSTKQQKIDRQYDEIKRTVEIDDKNIYVDKESGKDFDRKQYQKLLKKLKSGDLLVVKSIDRLGRDYRKILTEWSNITETIGADIKVLDMPLLDTSQTANGLTGKLISDIVLQLLSFIADNERANIRQRQAEGIKAAKDRGIVFGRPKISLPKNARTVFNQYAERKITSSRAASKLKISRSTFFKLLRETDSTNSHST